jgi:hypothetical protein
LALAHRRDLGHLPPIRHGAIVPRQTPIAEALPPPDALELATFSDARRRRGQKVGACDR